MLNFSGRIQPLLLSPWLTEDCPHPHPLLGTFALTSLISANAVERLVPLSSQNLTTQSNTSTLGLSEFELRRIGVAAAVSFLGGVIQVSGTETWEWRKGNWKERQLVLCFYSYLCLCLYRGMKILSMCFIFMETLLSASWINESASRNQSYREAVFESSGMSFRGHLGDSVG